MYDDFLIKEIDKHCKEYDKKIEAFNAKCDMYAKQFDESWEDFWFDIIDNKQR